MKTLVFDTETTGTVLDRLPLDHPDQPRLVQLGAILFDAARREVSVIDVIVDPGVEVPDGAARVHGITTEIARSHGIPEKAAVGVFARLAAIADVVVAHNAKFDVSITEIAAIRARFNLQIPGAVRCTMEAASPIVNLPPTERMLAAGFTKPKPPKLEEAIRFFFGEADFQAHRAIADVRAAARLYFELVTRGAWGAEGAAA